MRNFTNYGNRSRAALYLAFGLSLLSTAASTGIDQATAQTSAASYSLVVPSAFQLTPGIETVLPVQVRSAAALPRRAIVLIRGVPATITLSDGRLFESGVWGIAATDLGRVRMASDSASAGRSELILSLVAIDGTVLAEARSSLVVMAGAPGPEARAEPSNRTLATAASAQDILSDAPAPVRSLSPEQTEQLFTLVKKGDDQMVVGNVSAARLLYRHAAESGLAAGAFALAASYDDEELRKHRLKGSVQADPDQAQFWYEKARELGSSEARQRLQRFGSR